MGGGVGKRVGAGVWDQGGENEEGEEEKEVKKNPKC